MLMAQYGASVVKIEPLEGEWGRFIRRDYDKHSAFSVTTNLGKRSLALDLKSEEGKEALRKLIHDADIFIENFRPGVMERLGFGLSVLQARNPGLIYCSISGFGRDVPRAGYDLVLQGMGGIPSLTGEPDGTPAKCGASVADLVTGLNAVQGILAALVRRERTGQGGLVDVPMIDGQVSLLTYHASALLNAGVTPERLGNHHPSIHPYGTYQTRDGHLNLAIGNDGLWRRFCKAIGREEWMEDPRFETNASRVSHRQELDPEIEAVLVTDTVQGWCALLSEHGIPAGPINSVSEALEMVDVVAHEHPDGEHTVRSAPLPYRLDNAARCAPRRAPNLGEHTNEVIAEWESLVSDSV